MDDWLDLPHWTVPRALPGSHVRVVHAPGALQLLGGLARTEGVGRILLVTDAGIRAAGHLDRAVRSIYDADLVVRIFDQVIENPTTHCVERGVLLARQFQPDMIVGLGGGSSMDTAKGINFLYTNGGRMQDYWGTDKATQPMLPLIAIPTTAGTGSEAQSYALISDAETHTKMACGDKKALARLAILDPQLTCTCPMKVAAATGIDAAAHAIETAGCNRRNETSQRFSRQAWQLINDGFDEAIAWHRDLVAMTNPTLEDSPRHALERMLLGAHLAGCAIENSMLGAAHALANPLTARFDITHGVAVGLMLPHVVRFNAAGGENPYAALMDSAEALAQRVRAMLALVEFPQRLRDVDVPREALAELAGLAARQWTATFNPRPVEQRDLLKLYESAF
jgi:alcohol dehydrogenase